MTIGDMIYFCCDEGLLKVEVYDLNKDKVVWKGRGDEVPDKYIDEEISSWDVPCKDGTLTFNIEF